MDLTPKHRRSRIAEVIGREGQMSVEHLAARFDVSVETMRRDLGRLAEAGLMSQNARAGCVRCQACSALSTFERAFGGGRDGEAAPAALA